ncbi:large ribosomal subunit protein uL13-like [Ylistrum balloti]|uniref:large ribosomal subunit protein uL13-like n=1 Tax=Ylistrum balloti TaxID=509963 RepID=UPI002905ABA5|nr:large ribosomal subunit protein uL13-like [Ylistrum balloti]
MPITRGYMLDQKTVFVAPKDIQRKWYLIDAKDKILGRVATEVSKLLRGKHKVEFSPHQELGDYVIIINAEKVSLSGNKTMQKTYHRHSGFPGSLKSETFLELNNRKPGYVLKLAIKRMLPKNKLGAKLMNNVKIYAGETEHPHSAQKPEIYTL